MNFIKRIRLSSLRDNKINKYLMYASGEILLVVIGILIAISINNWNSKQLEKERARQFVHNLKIQFEQNLSNLDIHIDGFGFYYKSSKNLLFLIGNKKNEVALDKIDSLVFINAIDFHINLDVNTVTEGRENGDLALLASDSLRKSIYYMMTLHRDILERERLTNLNLNNQFLPYLNKNFNLRNLMDIGIPEVGFGRSNLYKNDNAKILEDQVFENLIITRMMNTQELLELYIELKEVISELYQKL